MFNEIRPTGNIKNIDKTVRRICILTLSLPKPVVETFKVVLTFSLWMKSPEKPLQQYLRMVLFVLWDFKKVKFRIFLEILLWPLLGVKGLILGLNGSRDKQLNFILSLSTHVFKWVLATYCWGYVHVCDGLAFHPGSRSSKVPMTIRARNSILRSESIERWRSF